MVKLKSKLILEVILVAGVIAFIMSCNKPEESVVAKTAMLVSDYSKAGEIHNAFLTNFKENFKEVEGVEDLEERIEVINNFNNEFVSSLDLPTQEKQMIIQELEDHKDLVVTKNPDSKTLSGDDLKSTNTEDTNIFDLIEQLKKSNQINENTYSILSRLSIDLKSNYEHLLSDAQLKVNIQELIKEFNNIGYNVDSGEGEMVATVLAISIASIEWWEDNPDAFADNLKSTKALPAWAAADVVGAAWGAATGAIGSYSGTGEVNWTAVGVGAVSGAVAGSTGIVGKAGKWISSLF